LADRETFVADTEPFMSSLYSTALRLSGNRSDAEDLVQETYLRAWRAIDKLKERKAARAWLYTILRREHARLYQRQRPECRDPANLPEIPVQGYDTRAEAHTLRCAFAGLTAEYSEPLLLQVIGGFSCDEIGDLLGLSNSAVMTRLYRARQRRRRGLGPAQQQGRAP